MRILWLVPHLTYEFGATKFIFTVISNLTKNHTVDLYVQKSSDMLKKKFQDIPVTITDLDKYSTGDIQFWFNFKNQINNDVKLLKNIAHKYDVVISTMFPMNIVGNSLGIPHVQYCFEPFAFFWDPLMINSLSISKRLFLNLFRKKFGKLDIENTKKSDIILTVNKGTKKWISKIYDVDSIPTYLGVDTNHFKKNYDKNLLKKYNGKKIIIHSTDWTPIKRTSWLIEQFSEMYSQREDIVLLITEISDGWDDKHKSLKIIKEKNLKNIILLGTVSYDMLPKYYSLADIAIYSGIGSGASAASLFVLECMACQTPVIRTNDSDEEIEHEKTGFLFEKNDKESFKKYVIKLLNDDKLREKFGLEAESFILEKYSWKKVTDIIEKECLSLIK